jgi:hypothetical protein
VVAVFSPVKTGDRKPTSAGAGTFNIHPEAGQELGAGRGKNERVALDPQRTHCHECVGDGDAQPTSEMVVAGTPCSEASANSSRWISMPPRCHGGKDLDDLGSLGSVKPEAALPALKRHCDESRIHQHSQVGAGGRWRHSRHARKVPSRVCLAVEEEIHHRDPGRTGECCGDGSDVCHVIYHSMISE